MYGNASPTQRRCLLAAGLPLVALEYKHVSLRLCSIIPSADDIAAAAVALLDRLGIPQVVAGKGRDKTQRLPWGGKWVRTTRKHGNRRSREDPPQAGGSACKLRYGKIFLPPPPPVNHPWLGWIISQPIML
jgi:hypothetical protein